MSDFPIGERLLRRLSRQNLNMENNPQQPVVPIPGDNTVVQVVPVAGPDPSSMANIPQVTGVSSSPPIKTGIQVQPIIEALNSAGSNSNSKINGSPPVAAAPTLDEASASRLLTQMFQMFGQSLALAAPGIQTTPKVEKDETEVYLKASVVPLPKIDFSVQGTID